MSRKRACAAVFWIVVVLCMSIGQTNPGSLHAGTQENRRPDPPDEQEVPLRLLEKWVDSAPFPHLAGTAPLVLPTDYPPGWTCSECVPDTDPRPFMAWQYRQIVDFFRKRIAATPAGRDRLWRNTDFSSVRAYSTSVQKHRDNLRKILGLLDFKPIETFRVVLQTGKLEVEDVTIWLTPDFNVRALVFTPRVRLTGAVIAIPPDAEAREDFAGMAEGETTPNWLQNLLDAHLRVAVPLTVQRTSDHPLCRRFNKDRRHILHLLGFIVGRSLVGLEVQQVLALRELLARQSDASGYPIELLAIGQGGMTALFAAAVDERFAGATVVDYFQQREESWEEPVDRMLYGQLTEFGDAELAALVAPRPLRVIYTAAGPTPFEKVREEVQRASRSYGGLKQENKLLIQTANDAAEALESAAADISSRRGRKGRERAFEIAVRTSREQVDQERNEHFESLHNYLRRLDQESDGPRQAHWNLLKTPAPERNSKAAALRRALAEYMGTIVDEGIPLNARTKLIKVTQNYALYEVLLDAVKGVEAYGELLVPRRGTGRFPVVICQHGGAGTAPKDLTGADLPEWQDTRTYHRYAAHLADLGYVTFAPHTTVPYGRQTEGKLVSPLVRMAASVGMMRSSIELMKLRRIVDFLQSLPFVDRERIGYYGLSYGGYHSLWLPPLEPRLKVSVISHFFKDWRLRLTDEERVEGLLNYLHDDFYTWNVLHRFGDAELVAAMWPRPACIEHGQSDAPLEWYLRAWEEVKTFSETWQAPDRYVQSLFDGEHEIHGIGTFDFLARWLRPELPAKRDYYPWRMRTKLDINAPGNAVDELAYVTHEVDSARGRHVRGTFYVSSLRPVFSGIAIRVSRAGNPGDLVIRFGSTRGAADLGIRRIPARVVPTAGSPWVNARIAPRVIDPYRLYFFEVRTDAGWVPEDYYVLYGPKPLGGRDYPENFGVSYQVLEEDGRNGPKPKSRVPAIPPGRSRKAVDTGSGSVGRAAPSFRRHRLG